MSSPSIIEDASQRVDRTKLVVIISIFVSFLILIPLGFSQELALGSEDTNGWVIVSVSDRVSLNSVAALDYDSALVVGEGGRIFYTNSSGSNWMQELSGSTNDLNIVEFGGISIAAGDSGTVLFREERVWVDHSIESGNNILDISISNYDTLSQMTVFTAGRGGEIWKYNGTNWTQLPSGVSSDLYGIDFLDENQGIAVGAGGLILGTEDGGVSWAPRDAPEDVGDSNLYCVDFTSPIRAFIAGEKGTFLRSSGTSGSLIGYDWITWDSGTNSTIRSISSSSINKLWIAGDDNLILLTKDGGATFNNQSYPSDLSVDLAGVGMYNGFKGFLVGNEGTVLYTNTEGVDPTLAPTVQIYDDFWEFTTLMYPLLVTGLKATVKIIGYALTIGFSIGVILAIFKTSQFGLRLPILLPMKGGGWNSIKFNPFKLFATIYTDIFRNTPLLVQFLFIHFGLVEIGVDLTFDGNFHRAYVSAIMALGLNSGAYQTEIIRSGIQAIPSGQMEAGRSIGLTYIQSMRFVILPQAIRIVIPPLGNEFINLVLNSSLASAIGYSELTRQGKLIIGITFRTFWTWSLVLMFYFAITYTLSNILKYLEKRLKVPGLGLGGED
tara:strand:+ start:1002 stop:2825 length:1824 start_codon:yes stop_codon:yes gene_type:complete